MLAQASFDYIIVGAGSSGCALANRLSEKATVLLLEAGGPDTSETIRNPSNVLKAIFQDPNISKPYPTEAQYHLGKRQVNIHRGIVRGGCSSIHGMSYVRGNRRDYDHWAQLGNEGWSFDEVLPYFKRSEKFEGGASEYHGVAGPLDVRYLPDPSPAALAFIQAAATLGYRGSRPGWDFNGPQQENGAGLYQVNITRDGHRASAAVAFLDPIKERDNLTTKTGVLVTRILIENGRATGVKTLENGSEQAYQVNREVILSAGAFESPKLLMLSGIGPVDQLRAHGITPLVDLPGVGQNLYDHLKIQIYHRGKKDPGQAKFIGEAALFVNTLDKSHAASPNLQYHFLAGRPGPPVDPAKEPIFLILPILCKPQSGGYVSLRTADPLDPMVIQPNYLQCEADVQVLARGIEFARELAQTSPLKEFCDGEPFFVIDPRVPGPRHPEQRMPVPTDSAPDLREIIKDHALTVWHPIGTCKMGRDYLAVVDPKLRVYGVGSLRVADASIIPTIPSGNTNAACLMIGEKAADLITGS